MARVPDGRALDGGVAGGEVRGWPKARVMVPLEKEAKLMMSGLELVPELLLA